MKTCQYSDIQQYINNVIPIRQESSRVYIYIKDGKKYAYKEYRATSLFSQNHISQMADYLNELFTPIKPNDYRDFQVFSAVPLCLVYDQTVFKGFIMECIPDRCYFQRTLRSGETWKEEGVLDWFWNGKINDYSDQDKASFVKRLIRAIKILHQHDIVLGDAISSNNLLIAEYDGMLAPFFIDTDSFRNKKENPTATYNSPNYYPPEGQTAISTKETDIYKLCLIILRFFSTDNIHRPSMVKGDLEANNSLNKIGSVFSDSFRKSVENGLSCNPKDRPTAYKMENDINNQFGKQQDIANAFHTDTQDKPTTIIGNSNPGGNTPSKLPKSDSATIAKTSKPKQVPSGSSSSKTTNSRSTTSSNTNKPKRSTADVQRVDKDSLNRFEQVKGSLVFILLNLVILVTILALSKCEVPPAPWDFFSRLIPLMARMVYIDNISFDGKRIDSRKIAAALWIAYLPLLLSLVCSLIPASIGSNDDLALVALAPLNRLGFAWNILSLPVFALVTIGSIKTLSAKGNSGQHLSLLRILSTTLCSVLAMLLVIGTVKQVNEFKDVAQSDYFFNPVMWATTHEPPITAGVAPGQFGPHNPCTREQIVTFLWAANGKPAPAGTGSTFSDVPADAWYYKPVMWAVENKVTRGLPDGSFGVGQPCTRAQAMTFLWASQGKPAPASMESTFSDVTAGNWFCKAILWAAENGITKGVGNGLFGVNNTCTRAQIITFLYKAYN